MNSYPSMHIDEASAFLRTGLHVWTRHIRLGSDMYGTTFSHTFFYRRFSVPVYNPWVRARTVTMSSADLVTPFIAQHHVVVNGLTPGTLPIATMEKQGGENTTRP